MIIHHPILGPRDAQEFVHLGDASLIDRPDGMTAGVEASTTMPTTATTRRESIASFGIMSRATGLGWW